MAEPRAGVQSVGRALEILELVEAAGGDLALVELSAASGLPAPTIHRLVRTLVDRSYLRQLPNRRYALGARLIPLGNTARTVFGASSGPHLAAVVEELGETVNLATLDGDMVVYVAQVPSPHAMRMFTELGRHVHPHCRAAGKVLLSGLSDQEVRDLLVRTGMPARTSRTITDPEVLIAQLARVRADAVATEIEEMEVGVQCVSVPVPTTVSPLAISISAPTARMSDHLRDRGTTLLRAAARRIADDIAGARSPSESA
ncbi:IclR family transcriptional regulator [Calidifontibacter terrae]